MQQYTFVTVYFNIISVSLNDHPHGQQPYFKLGNTRKCFCSKTTTIICFRSLVHIPVWVTMFRVYENSEKNFFTTKGNVETWKV